MKPSTVGSDNAKTASEGSDVAKSAEKPTIHSTPAESVPTANSTVAEIKAYLDAHKISYTSSANKADLLKLIPAK